MHTIQLTLPSCDATRKEKRMLMQAGTACKVISCQENDDGDLTIQFINML